MFYYRQDPLHYVNSSEKYTTILEFGKRLSITLAQFLGANNRVLKNHQARFFSSSRSECYVAADTQFTGPCLLFDPNPSHITNSTGSHPNKVIPLELFSARTHFCKQLLKCYRIHQKFNNSVYRIILSSLNMPKYRWGYARQRSVSNMFCVNPSVWQVSRILSCHISV
jgi:hypothetical protein